MVEKNVLVIVKSRPYTNLNTYEALRVAAGLWEHHIILIWMGDGVHALLKDVDQTLSDKFYSDFPDLEIKPYVDEGALKTRGLGADDVLPWVELATGEKIKELVQGADASLVF